MNVWLLRQHLKEIGLNPGRRRAGRKYCPYTYTVRTPVFCREPHGLLKYISPVLFLF